MLIDNWSSKEKCVMLEVLSSMGLVGLMVAKLEYRLDSTKFFITSTRVLSTDPVDLDRTLIILFATILWIYQLRRKFNVC